MILSISSLILFNVKTTYEEMFTMRWQMESRTILQESFKDL